MHPDTRSLGTYVCTWAPSTSVTYFRAPGSSPKIVVGCFPVAKHSELVYMSLSLEQSKILIKLVQLISIFFRVKSAFSTLLL